MFARANLSLLFILFTVGLDAIGIGLIFPVMPDLMEDVTHAGLGEAALWGGVLAASFAVMQFLCGPLVGNLSDRYGRRPVLLVSLAVMALDYVAMALAHTVWLLLAARLVAGVAAATHATANAYVADISTPDERAKRFGLIGAAFGIGFVAGPMLGGLLAGIDVRAPFWAAAGLALANLVFGWFVMPESLGLEKRRGFTLARANPLASLRAVRRLPGLQRLLLVSFLYAVTFNVWPAIWAYYGKAAFGWNAQWIGFGLAAFGVCMALTQALLLAPMIRRLGERRTAAVGMGLEVVSYGFYGFATSGFWALVFTPIAALGGVTGPSLQAMMSRAVPENQQGELQGVNSSLNALAMIVAPLVMTWVFGIFTSVSAPFYLPGAPFLLSATIMVAVVILFVAGTREAKRP
ncbi:TCR/Tet family MFS transporter [Cypionkella sp.]|uniref:TCR/Tet family MFS transporter n=1 Tax=Cypionkella sp. TaxID=2811411 RepID=UPI0027238D15|nr:TCR/Tet family MFS transporter [Cypionkella sp.]MDO8986118.1 TCR/Tet family MFS transporter [Cypionkella sp.]MDP2047507.1 TCR/Tet family MFS transporter [Cypionkella sp.]